MGMTDGLTPLTDGISVFAFYRRSKTLLAFIITLYLAEMAAQVVIMALTLPSIESIPDPLPSRLDANGCLALNIPALLPVLW